MYSPKLSELSKALFITASSILAIACSSNKQEMGSSDKQEMRFNRGLWKKWEDINYPDIHHPYRDRMLNDLVKNHKLKGLTYQQLIDLLGTPGNFGDNDDTVRYEIFTGFESDIDPAYGKNLNLTLGADSIVASYKISEWKHK